MIKIKDIEAKTEDILEILKGIKVLQKEIEDSENIVYSRISLYFALQNKIFSKNLILHPANLATSKFYEDRVIIKEKGQAFKEYLYKLINYELTANLTFLSKEELDNVIKIFNKIKKDETKEE